MSYPENRSSREIRSIRPIGSPREIRSTRPTRFPYEIRSIRPIKSSREIRFIRPTRSLRGIRSIREIGGIGGIGGIGDCQDQWCQGDQLAEFLGCAGRHRETACACGGGGFGEEPGLAHAWLALQEEGGRVSALGGLEQAGDGGPFALAAPHWCGLPGRQAGPAAASLAGNTQVRGAHPLKLAGGWLSDRRM
ncbi:hypothetical protein Acor_14940 [Acrocarpospora corrugata]|uniref:Uncharacterized protein n=1 Tax=Acrocarpospora corrugata TaxID=35763 RepID=A0A5M3VXB7_9ACTN|nr:hypothetical protein Acor_14940 [Acrocarpospora corrugata]